MFAHQQLFAIVPCSCYLLLLTMLPQTTYIQCCPDGSVCRHDGDALAAAVVKCQVPEFGSALFTKKTQYWALMPRQVATVRIKQHVLCRMRMQDE